MSFSSTVDYRYRLIASDLGGRMRTVMVTRVSYQGVENLQPMLHFEGIAKPLALDVTQRLVISQIARSTAVSDWVGLIIELHPIEQEARAWIEVTAVGGKRPKARAAADPQRARTNVSTSTWRERIPAVEEPQRKSTFKESNREPGRESSRESSSAKATTGNAVAPESERSLRWFALHDIPQTSIWTPILLGVLVILAFIVVYQLETDTVAWQEVSSWLTF